MFRAPTTCQSPHGPTTWTVVGDFSPLSSCWEGTIPILDENVEVQSLVTSWDYAAKVTK